MNIFYALRYLHFPCDFLRVTFRGSSDRRLCTKTNLQFPTRTPALHVLYGNHEHIASSTQVYLSNSTAHASSHTPTATRTRATCPACTYPTWNHTEITTAHQNKTCCGTQGFRYATEGTYANFARWEAVCRERGRLSVEEFDVNHCELYQGPLMCPGATPPMSDHPCCCLCVSVLCVWRWGKCVYSSLAVCCVVGCLLRSASFPTTDLSTCELYPYVPSACSSFCPFAPWLPPLFLVLAPTPVHVRRITPR